MQVLSPVYCKMEIKLMAMQPSACKKNYKKNLKLTIKKIKRQVKGHLKCESQLMHTTNILFVFRRSWTGKRWKSYSWSILLAHIIFFYQRKRPVSSSTEYTAGLTALISAGDTCLTISSLYWYLFWISKSENNRLELYFT